jgi:hypothetical protein
LVSEYYWGKKSTKGSFILRDRIQSGLSLSVLVVETKEKGGTMHTVEYCNKQRRPLIVLENPKDSNYTQHFEGNVELIRDKVADFVLKTDNEYSNFLIIFNTLEDKKISKIINEKYFQNLYQHEVSNKDLENYTIYLTKWIHEAKTDNNFWRFQNFVNFLYNNSFSYKFEYSKENGKKLIKEDDITTKCQKCKNYNECKLVEEGFVDLCPVDVKDKNLFVMGDLRTIH